MKSYKHVMMGLVVLFGSGYLHASSVVTEAEAADESVSEVIWTEDASGNGLDVEDFLTASNNGGSCDSDDQDDSDSDDDGVGSGGGHDNWYYKCFAYPKKSGYHGKGFMGSGKSSSYARSNALKYCYKAVHSPCYIKWCKKVKKH